MAGKSIYRPEYGTLVALLRKARESAGLTQAELATRLGRRQSYVSAVERGRRRLDLLELRDHCLACDQGPLGVMERFEAAIADGSG